MEDLVKQVSEKTGLSEEMSKTVVEMVINYLKEKLPEPIAGQIDGILSGDSATSGLGGMVGGLFG
jgi:hypothetical protein